MQWQRSPNSAHHYLVLAYAPVMTACYTCSSIQHLCSSQTLQMSWPDISRHVNSHTLMANCKRRFSLSVKLVGVQAGIGRPQLQNRDTAEDHPLLQRCCSPHVPTEEQTSEPVHTEPIMLLSCMLFRSAWLPCSRCTKNTGYS